MLIIHYVNDKAFFKICSVNVSIYLLEYATSFTADIFHFQISFIQPYICMRSLLKGVDFQSVHSTLLEIVLFSIQVNFL